MKSVHGVRTVSKHGLLGNVVEHLLDKGTMSGRGVGCEFGDISCAGQLDRFAILCLEVRHRIDWLVLVLQAPSPHRVVVLEAEAKGIDRDVAGHTGFVPCHFSDFLAHREIRVELAFLELICHWRRF